MDSANGDIMTESDLSDENNEEENKLELVEGISDFGTEKVFMSDLSDENPENENKLELGGPSRAAVNDKEFVARLISLYKENPNLWDYKHKDYSIKEKRYETLKKITKILKAYISNYTVNQLKKKINILRTNFNKERRRLERVRRTGGCEKEPTLWYYNDLRFLSTGIRPKRDSVVDSETDTTSKAKSHITLIPRKKRRVSSYNGSSQGPGLAPVSHLDRSGAADSSDADVVGRYWAGKLARLQPEQRIFAEKIINDILFEGALGNLTKNGVYIIKSPEDETD